MRYFLTGATGFIEERLAVLLKKEGHDIVALVRSPEKAEALKAIGVTLAKGDITDAASLRTAMAGCDGVFHVAGWYTLGPGARDGEGVRINKECALISRGHVDPRPQAPRVAQATSGSLGLDELAGVTYLGDNTKARAETLLRQWSDLVEASSQRTSQKGNLIMITKPFVTLVSLILLSTFLLSLTGCGGNKKDSEDTSRAQQTTR